MVVSSPPYGAIGVRPLSRLGRRLVGVGLLSLSANVRVGTSLRRWADRRDRTHDLCLRRAAVIRKVIAATAIGEPSAQQSSSFCKRELHKPNFAEWRSVEPLISLTKNASENRVLTREAADPWEAHFEFEVVVGPRNSS